jgi:hypothetical protein
MSLFDGIAAVGLPILESGMIPDAITRQACRMGIRYTIVTLRIHRCLFDLILNL